MLKMLLVAALIMLGACGPAAKVRRINYFDEAFFRSFTQDPMVLKKQTTKCLNQIFTDTNVDLLIWLNGTYQHSQKSLHPVLSGNFIRSIDQSVIKSTSYGLHANLDYTNPHRPVERMFKEEQPVDVCPGEIYESYTVESAALNASYFINQTNEKVKAADPNLDLAPISLQISPLISITGNFKSAGGLSKKTVYLTDNATYNPKDKTISFLPHSKTKRTDFNVDLWAIPFVPAHEYGHHVFESYMEQGLGSSSGCFDFGHTHSLQMDFVPDVPARTRILSAYNEGFADLVANYTLSNGEASVNTISRLGLNRDILWPNLLNSASKKFDPVLLSNYLTETNPMFSPGEHIMGAIFAYQANRLLSTLTTSKETKLQLLLGWMRSLKAKKAAMSRLSDTAFFREIHSTFIQTVMQSTASTYTKSLCEEIEDGHPGLRATIPECNSL